MLESLFNKLCSNFIKKETPTQVISCEHSEIFKNTYYEKHLQLLLLCTSPVSSTIVFQIYTELLLYVQPSLLRDIFCVIFIDNKI